MPTTQTPTFAEILDAVIHDRLKQSFGGWMPARIESYDSSKNRASVQVLIYDDYTDEEGERQIEAFPVLNDVPVGFISLGGKFCIRSTVSVGDEGLVLFPSRPTAKWLAIGGMVDPQDDTPHDFNGAVFLPFRLSAGGTNADPAIIISPTDVQIGGNVGLAFITELNALRAAYNSHKHTGVSSGSSISGPPENGETAYSGTQKLKGG